MEFRVVQGFGVGVHGFRVTLLSPTTEEHDIADRSTWGFVKLGVACRPSLFSETHHISAPPQNRKLLSVLTPAEHPTRPAFKAWGQVILWGFRVQGRGF